MMSSEEPEKILVAGYFDARPRRRLSGQPNSTNAGTLGDVHRNPSLHLWSLGVEEQFYLLFPVLILCVYGDRVLRSFSDGASNFTVARTVNPDARRGVFFLSIFWLLSFATSAYLSFHSPDHAFYQMPSRFWQLLAGAMVFHFSLYYDSGHRPIGATLFVDFGNLALLGGAIFLVGGGQPWPVPWSLLGVMGSASYYGPGILSRPHFIPPSSREGF